MAVQEPGGAPSLGRISEKALAFAPSFLLHEEAMGPWLGVLALMLVGWFPASGYAQSTDVPAPEPTPIPDVPVREETLPNPVQPSPPPAPPADTAPPSAGEAPASPPPPPEEPKPSEPEAPLVTIPEEPRPGPPPSAALPMLFDGDYLTTVDRLRKELRLDPTSTDVRFALGQALYGLGEVDEALEEFRQVVQERPTSVSARLHLATALMAKRRWKDAQREVTAVLAQDSKIASAHHVLASIRYSQGDVRGAIDAYRAALALAPDSAETHYHLGLVLRLAGRMKEALPELQAAAEAGHPKAQYFLGTAYASGAGPERDLVLAIRWWIAASEHGIPEAQDALSRLRKTALKPASSKEPNKTLKAFQSYRQDLWFEFPELAPNGTDETVGIALLQAFRVTEAVPTLIREATAMGELSERYLAALYEQGLPPLLKAHDPRILRYFEMAANDGAPQARLALARFHALGLGVPADRGKALAIIKGLPSGYAEQFLQDLATRPAGTAPQTAPPPPAPEHAPSTAR